MAKRIHKGRKRMTRAERAAKIEEKRLRLPRIQQFFAAHYTRAGLTQADLVRRLEGTGIDKTRLSRLAHAKPDKLDMSEAQRICDALGADPAELMEAWSGEPMLPRSIVTVAALEYTADAKGRLQAAGTRLAMIMPPGIRHPANTIKIVAPGSPYDGWIAVTNRMGEVDRGADGKLCLVRSFKGEEFLGFVSRDNETRHWAITPLGAAEPVCERLLVEASPILWLRAS